MSYSLPLTPHIPLTHCSHFRDPVAQNPGSGSPCSQNPFPWKCLGADTLSLRFLPKSELLRETLHTSSSPDSIPTLQGQEVTPLLENTCTPLVSAGVTFVVKHPLANIHRAHPFEMDIQ